jgi:hypothetical protein
VATSTFIAALCEIRYIFYTISGFKIAFLGVKILELESGTLDMPSRIHAEDLPGHGLLAYEADKSDVRRVNLDMPEWVIQALDKEATRRGITRQALIKTWIVDKLDDESRERKSLLG